MDLVKSKVKRGWKAICIDGSAFDSTQNATMMALIDTNFFMLSREGIKSLLLDFRTRYPNHFTADMDRIMDILLKQATDLNNICFTEVPEIERVHWPDRVYNVFI